jgi:cyclopropane fatty-acyl-phospholipid synthase-like methyltransferase
LEVGNVLSHYYPVHHDIVDKYEKAPGVTNVDIRNFDTPKDYDLIVSISTIEHVGYDEAEFEKAPGDDEAPLKAQESKDSKSPEEPVSIAIENLKSHLSQAGKIVITVPLGYNPALDRLLKEKKIFTDIRYLKRISKNNIWREANGTEIQNVRHDWQFGQFGRANALAVCVFQRVPKSSWVIIKAAAL